MQVIRDYLLASSIATATVIKTCEPSVAVHSTHSIGHTVGSGACCHVIGVKGTACTATELIEALKANFVGYEKLRAKLLTLRNMTDVEELKKALEAPEEYRHLIVRVGGYSARFVTLNRALQ